MENILALTPEKINSLEKVKVFFTALKEANYTFHPDDDFTEYSNTPVPVGKHLNALMEKCWTVCEFFATETTDIYTVAMEILYPETYKK